MCGSAKVPFHLWLTMCNCGSITMITWGGATAGFMQQFAAVCHPDRSETNMAAVLKELSGGQTPNRVICTGHSLGGALATLGQLLCCAVLCCAVLSSHPWGRGCDLAQPLMVAVPHTASLCPALHCGMLSYAFYDLHSPWHLLVNVHAQVSAQPALCLLAQAVHDTGLLEALLLFCLRSVTYD